MKPTVEDSLLDSVARLLASAPDGLNLSFLSSKFSNAFDRFRGGKPGRDDRAFKQWLTSTGRFKFAQDSSLPDLCLVALK